MKHIFLLLATFFFTLISGQSRKDSVKNQQNISDSLQVFIPTIKDYQFFKQNGEKKSFDTVFTIDKYYQFIRYNNRDSFGKIQFANIGSGFQDLVFENKDSEDSFFLLPKNKSYFISHIKDIDYYDVKTPTTAFVLHNGVNEGMALKSTYTQNIGKNFNFSLEYMGLRSKGFYRRSLAANHHFILTSHYFSNDRRYQYYFHFVSENENNEENGGIVSLDNYLNDSRFKNRNNLEVNLTGVDTRFDYLRYYFSQEYQPIHSEKYPFKIKHTSFYQKNKYRFNQKSEENYLKTIGGNLISGKSLDSQKYSENFSHTLSLLFDNQKFKLEAGLRYQIIKLNAEDFFSQNGNFLPNENREHRLGVIGNLKVDLGNRFLLTSSLEVSKGAKFGNYLDSRNQLYFELMKGIDVNAEAHFTSSVPDFNYLVNSSAYSNLNQSLDFKNQNITQLGGFVYFDAFKTKLFTHYFRVDNYAYIDEIQQAKQLDSSLNILQIGMASLAKYHDFNLESKLLFQNVLTNKSYYPSPQWVARLNLYYQSKMFKKAAEIQTGLKGYWFSRFASRDYSPVWNDFSLPTSSSYSIGGNPILDAYFNMKVKRMLIYFEGQNVSALLMKNRNYTVPYYPISDFRINIGLVWYLFH